MNNWRLLESTHGKLALYQGDELVADQVMPVLALTNSSSLSKRASPSSRVFLARAGSWRKSI